MEISTFVVLQLDLKLSQGGLSFFIGLQWLNASIVLPDESLQLCLTVGELRRSLREDLVRVRLVHVISLGLASLVKLISLDERS